METTQTDVIVCPGCGCEPEVVNYLRDIKTKKRRGYHCSCGVTVVDGIVVGSSLLDD